MEMLPEFVRKEAERIAVEDHDFIFWVLSDTVRIWRGIESQVRIIVPSWMALEIRQRRSSV